MNDEKSDVVFLIEGQPLPAQKAFLSIKNKVFRAMFSDKFKESKDKEVVIEDTTFEAFKAFIWFLYSEELVIKDCKDLNLIEEVVKLSDRYEANRLMERLITLLTQNELTFNNFEQISRIAFRYKIYELITKVKAFIDKNFNKFVSKNQKELKLLYESTDGLLLEVMANNYREMKTKLRETKNILDQIENEPFCSCEIVPTYKIHCKRCGTLLN